MGNLLDAWAGSHKDLKRDQVGIKRKEQTLNRFNNQYHFSPILKDVIYSDVRVRVAGDAGGKELHKA